MKLLLPVFLTLVFLGCSKPEVTELSGAQATEYFRSSSFDPTPATTASRLCRINYGSTLTRTVTEFWFIEMPHSQLPQNLIKFDNLPVDIPDYHPRWFPEVSEANYLGTSNDGALEGFWFFKGSTEENIYGLFNGLD